MKKGFTLVEVLVAVGLFSVVTLIAIGGFTRALRTQRQVAGLIAAQSNVSLVLEQIAREIRTGYLFCHDVGGSPLCTCASGGGPNSCGIAPPNGNVVTTDLNFFNALGANVVYSFSGSGQAITKSDSGPSGPAQAITGTNVAVKYLRFTIFGNEQGDHWAPRVTISVGIAPSSTDPGIANAVLDLQTTVSARGVDCDTTTSSTAC